jgi:ribosome-associated protein
MKNIYIHTETIRLSQLLKLTDLVQDGLDAKIRIQNGEALVNGTVDKRRGRKLKNGDCVTFAGFTFQVKHE